MIVSPFEREKATTCQSFIGTIVCFLSLCDILRVSKRLKGSCMCVRTMLARKPLVISEHYVRERRLSIIIDLSTSLVNKRCGIRHLTVGRNRFMCIQDSNQVATRSFRLDLSIKSIELTIQCLNAISLNKDLAIIDLVKICDKQNKNQKFSKCKQILVNKK